MMTNLPTVTWRLQPVMRAAEVFSNEDLKRRLAGVGVDLSSSQVHRLVTETPERLNLTVLAALCQVLDTTPDDLIHTRDAQPKPARTASTGSGGNVVDLTDQARPRRARIVRDNDDG